MSSDVAKCIIVIKRLDLFLYSLLIIPPSLPDLQCVFQPSRSSLFMIVSYSAVHSYNTGQKVI